MDLTDTIAQLIDYGKQLAGPQEAAGANIPYVINGDGNPIVMPNLIYNEHNERPERIKANVQVFDVPSFCKYWTDFGDGNSRCFADESKLTITTIIDYHEDDTTLGADGDVLPRWCQHRVSLALQQSEEWKVWIAGNNKILTQQQFAEFLEQNSMDISAPAPGAMMEIARDLVATVESDFSAGIRMQDGQVKFKWSETVNAKMGSGTLQIPEHFTITIPVFVGGPRVDVKALFRFRVKEGKLTMWYTLVRPDEARRAAFGEARTTIADTMNRPILNGVYGADEKK